MHRTRYRHVYKVKHPKDNVVQALKQNKDIEVYKTPITIQVSFPLKQL